jgi:argininosuccinate lyase
VRGALESLAPDEDRMRTLMRHDYLEAADVADYLAQTRGVPFRQTYRWLGEAVRLSEESGQTLAEGVNTVLRRERRARPLDAREVAQLGSPDFLVGRRASAGGPAPESVRAQCQVLGGELRGLSRRAASHASALDRARARLREAMRRHGG